MEILGLRILQSNNINHIPSVIELDSKDMAKCLRSQPVDTASALLEGEVEPLKNIDLALVKAVILKKITHYLTYNRTAYFDLALEFLTSYGRIAVVSNCNMLYFYAQKPLVQPEENSLLHPISEGLSLTCERHLAAVGAVRVPSDQLSPSFYIENLTYHFDTAQITFDIDQTKLLESGFAYLYKMPHVTIEEKYLLADLPIELKQIGMLFAMHFENDAQLLTNIKDLQAVHMACKTVSDFFFLEHFFKDLYKYYYLCENKIINAEELIPLQMLQLNDLVTAEDLAVRELYGANIVLNSMYIKGNEAHKLAMKTQFDFPSYYARKELLLKLPLAVYNQGIFETCISNSQQYLARKFINEETVIDTALICIIHSGYVQTDTALVDVKAKLLAFADHLKKHTKQPLHDLALYFEALILFVEKHGEQQALFDYFVTAARPDEMTAIIKTVNNLLLGAKKHDKEKLAAQLLKDLNEKSKPLAFDAYLPYLRKDTTLSLYAHALRICNEYASVDLKTLKRAANHQRMQQMLHHELHNAFTPQRLRGKDYCGMVLYSYVRGLLAHTGKPTKEQRALFHKLTQIVPMDCKAYSHLSPQSYQKLTELIADKNKLQGAVLEALPDYEVELLDANDFRNLITGDATNCCMSAGTKKQIVYTYAEAFNQIIITNVRTSRIVLDSVIWRNLFDFLVIDNIEAIQVNLVNTQIYRLLTYKMAKMIVSAEHLKGFIQGTHYNDLELYKTDASAAAQPCIALDKAGRYYHHFYSDAVEVKSTFEDPLTKQELHFELPPFIDVTTV